MSFRSNETNNQKRYIANSPQPEDGEILYGEEPEDPNRYKQHIHPFNSYDGHPMHQSFHESNVPRMYYQDYQQMTHSSPHIPMNSRYPMHHQIHVPVYEPNNQCVAPDCSCRFQQPNIYHQYGQYRHSPMMVPYSVPVYSHQRHIERQVPLEQPRHIDHRQVPLEQPRHIDHRQVPLEQPRHIEHRQVPFDHSGNVPYEQRHIPIDRHTPTDRHIPIEQRQVPRMYNYPNEYQSMNQIDQPPNNMMHNRQIYSQQNSHRFSERRISVDESPPLESDRIQEAIEPSSSLVIINQTNGDEREWDNDKKVQSPKRTQPEKHSNQPQKKQTKTPAASKRAFKPKQETPNNLSDKQKKKIIQENSVTETKIKKEPSITSPTTSFDSNYEIGSNAETDLLRLRLLQQEYEKQKSSLNENQTNYEIITRQLEHDLSKYTENSNTIATISREIINLKKEIQTKKDVLNNLTNENTLIDPTINSLREKKASLLSVINGLNESIVKKKLMINQLETKQETEKSKNRDELRQDYDKKLKKAYHQLLENKLNLAKKQLNGALHTFPTHQFVYHLFSQLFDESQEIKCNSIDGFDKDKKTFSVYLRTESNGIIHFTAPNVLFSLFNAQSNGTTSDSEEKYLAELVFDYYCNTDVSFEMLYNDFTSFSSDDSFKLSSAIEYFTNKIVNSKISGPALSEKRQEITKKYVKFNVDHIIPLTLDINHLKAFAPEERIFSSKLYKYISESSNKKGDKSSSRYFKDQIDWESFLSNNPENQDSWSDYALSKLPATISLDNVKGNDAIRADMEVSLSIMSNAIEANPSSESLWVLYLDLFSLFFDAQQAPDELSEVFSQAIEYVPNSTIIPWMFIMTIHNLPDKITFIKKFIKESIEKEDHYQVALLISALVKIYSDAGYYNCARSMIISFFIDENSFGSMTKENIESMLNWETHNDATPESFSPKSFIFTFYGNDTENLSDFLWLLAIYFLIFDEYPQNIFCSFPYEFIADTSCLFQIKPSADNRINPIYFDISMSILNYLSLHHPENTCYSDSLEALGISEKAPAQCTSRTLNEQLSTENITESIVTVIQQCSPSFSQVKLSNPVIEIDRIMQKSLGIFADFERASVIIPNKKNDPYLWINYIHFVLANQELLSVNKEAHDVTSLYETVLNTITGNDRLVISIR